MMDQEYKNILVGIDGSEQAMRAFKKAVEIGRRNHSKVYVTNVIDQQFYNFMGYMPLDQSIVDQEAENAKEMLEECKKYGQSVDFADVEGIIAYGSAKETIAIKLTRQYAIDLIVVGQSGLNAVERFITGSVASYIIREAPCDVLIVADEEEPGATK